MTVHYSDESVQLHHGDCLDVLRGLPDNSVDAVVCDPPYGLEFMGKEWDRFSGAVTDRDFKGFVLSQQRTRNVKCPECGKWAYDHPGRACECGGIRRAQGNAFQQWCELWTAECLRVLKPGGMIAAFGGTRTFHRLACAIEDAGFEVRDSIGYGHTERPGLMAWVTGQGFPKSKNLPGGFGSALKPAWEPIVLARKPLTGTLEANFARHGTGALNIDGCRVGLGNEKPPTGSGGPNTRASMAGGVMRGVGGNVTSTAGRWPTNVVLDESQAAALDAEVGTLTSGKMKPTHTTAGVNGRGTYGADAAAGFTTMETYGDSGGPSRFFPTFKYAAKAPTRERPKVGDTAHPTVKPLALMQWLIRLVTPPGGVVLEPFAGSGTTVEACLLEGFRCIAIEREADYLPLIEARIARQRKPVEAPLVAGDVPLFEGLSPKKSKGRWPTNVVLSQDAAEELDEQSGELRARGNKTPTVGGGGMYGHGITTVDHGEGDTGGASRFFPVFNDEPLTLWDEEEPA